MRATGHKRGRDFREPQKIAIICLKFGVHLGNVGQYVRTRSVGLDLKIILMTLMRVSTRHGAF
ncbi:MAG: hypothetical protein CR217_15465 [Beijerinckiaceae bacterium]|nr:MAG: hypothetical protein CR217_15465 [Beijerinckiaceae bacterium]